MSTAANQTPIKKLAILQDMKERLFTLWLFAMLTYTYGDVVTLMDPIKHGTMEMTETFLLGGSIFMMIPISMVLLSRILKYRANRVANIIAGTHHDRCPDPDAICRRPDHLLCVLHGH